MNMCEDHVYDLFCEVNVNTKECPQGHFDFLTFTTLLQHRDTLSRGINYYNSSYSSHNKFSTVITTNHPVTTKTTKNECTHSAEPSPQV